MPNMPNTTKIRLAYLDNLKALMIIFVVMMHTAVTYSMNGIWFYEEKDPLNSFSFYTFLFYQTFTQAYFMSLLFIISGYFVPHALEKKGTKQFIKDRFIRLGIPLLIFIFIIYPICMKMIYPQFTFSKTFLDGIISFKFLSWTGPLWFVESLLIFAIFYIAIKKWIDKLCRYSFAITSTNILGLIALLTLATFVIRLFFPIGSSDMNLQLGDFTTYILLFLLGIIAYSKGIFEKIDYKTAKKWFYLSFGVGIPIWLILINYGVTRNANMIGMTFSGTGGFNFLSFLEAFWESFFCVAIIVGFIGIFKEKFNKQNKLQKFLSSNCFAVYVFHSPILIGTALLLKNVSINPLGKCLLVISIVLPLSFITASLIRSIPLLRKIFS